MAFRLKGRDLDPQEMSDGLRLIPTRAFRRGDPFRAGKVEHARAYGMWMLSTEEVVHSDDLMEHHRRLLEWLGPVRPQIQRYRSREGIEASIAFWWEPTDGPVGFTFPAVELRALTDLCDEFDFYFA
jgi:hypothetical protein